MRGRIDRQGEIFHTFNLEELVPADHPLRSVKLRADKVLSGMSRWFSGAYSKTGRKSIPPERLIKALLLQALYSIRSEIQLCEQISYNMRYRWFLDMTPSESVWTPEVFSMNRKRFDQHGFVRDFFDRVVHEAILEGLVSEDHFSVDGTLIQSFASMKSLRPIGTMLDHVRRRHGLWPRTLGADAGYKDGAYLDALEQFGIDPHVPVGDGPIQGDPAASHARRRARSRGSTAAYAISQRIRKRVEEIIGWCKAVGGLARCRFVGRWKIKQQGEVTAAAYNLLSMARLAPMV